MADPVINPVNDGPDPLNNVNFYIRQWEEMQNLINADKLSLMAAIEHMLALAKSGRVDEAFQVAETAVMPGAMTLQGDKMGKLASTMNISSALLELTTAAQNITNAGKDITKEQAEKFVSTIKALYKALQEEMNLPAKKKFMDDSTALNIMGALDKIAGDFTPDKDSKNPITSPLDPRFNAETVAKDLIHWIENPDSGGNNGTQTGQQHLQNLQAGLTQWNNTESAQSQGLQAQEQFAANTYNQYMNSCLNIFQAQQKQIQSMVQNQKSS